MDDLCLGGLGEWGSAIDHLLAAPPTTAETTPDAATGANDGDAETEAAFDLDASLGDWAFLWQGANVEPAGEREEVQTQNLDIPPPTTTVVPIAKDMYGPLHDVSAIGLTVQKGMFANFCHAATSRAFNKEAPLQQCLETEYVHTKTLKSFAAVESSSGHSSPTIRRGLLQYACTLLYGATLLIGAFFLAWSRVFGAGRQFEPVIAIWKRKYDETPLKMKVKEHNSFYGTAIPEGASDKAYLHSKILRIECSVSFLLEFLVNFLMLTVSC